MPLPSREQLLEWAERYVALWNAGDKDGWIRNWKRVAPGEIRMLDPVGTPEKRGFEHCCAGPFDLFQKTVRFRVREGSLFLFDSRATRPNRIARAGFSPLGPARG